MTDPMELVGIVEGRIGVAFDGECHLTEDEARQIAACIREMVEKWPSATPAETQSFDETACIQEVHYTHGAKTLRDEFAIAALTSAIPDPGFHTCDLSAGAFADQVARYAYALADSMMKEREK